MSWIINAPLSDEMLVAYLDNQLNDSQSQQVEKMLNEDPELVMRLNQLDSASLDFAAAFSPLLDEAPLKPMQEKLTIHPQQAPQGISRRTLIAATVSALAIGLVGGMKGRRLFDNDDGWRDTVAQYMALYTRETLSGGSLTPAAASEQLALVSQRLGLQLNATVLTLSDSEFKGARMLSYDGVSIAQIVWQDRQSGPLALCITAASQPEDTAFSQEKRRGMNVVYWRQQHYKFMLIGHSSARQLREMAQNLAEAV
ncbi:anti-sigma factor [Pantoea sp. BAV 3049]|uniref:anti-sigma factor family protein n=1 Tax=Pantoea sp. BAV 3049 TaxID=2654188 RepID=UPI00131AA649|nr:anti-sigma factor [Pantoea sp. BAV 3049]